MAFDQASDTQSEAACRLFASRYGIDFDEALYHEGISLRAIQEQYSNLRAALPEIKNVGPSGNIPAGALRTMLIGVLAAIPASLVLMAFAAILGFGILSGLNHLAWGSSSKGAILVGIVAMLFFTLPGVFGGLVSARVVTRFGRKQKNRNSWIAATLSSIAAGAAILILSQIFSLFLSVPLRRWDPFRMGDNLGGFSAAFFGTTFVCAVISGFKRARSIVNSERFCNRCQEIMTLHLSASLRSGAMKTMVFALVSGSVSLAAAAVRFGAGIDGAVTLKRCGVCGEGDLEASVALPAMKPNHMGWCVAVQSLSKDEMDTFVTVHRLG